MSQAEDVDGSAALLETATTYAQKCLQADPVIVLGSGASIPHGIPGMPALQQHLLANVPSMQMSTEESGKWSEFTTALESKDLESALLEIKLPANITARIVEETWKCIGAADSLVFAEVLKDRYALSLTKLYHHLYRSSNTIINVVTTNYDRLAEYAANAGGIRSYVGFTDGYLRGWDSRLAELFHYDRPNSRKLKVRTVCVWKVHGSLDWFRGEDDVPLALPMSSYVPSGYSPLIVTPGIDKYENTHYEPFRSVLSQADSVLMNSGAFFCIGYGFNDKHIQPKLIEHCYQNKCPIVMLAKQLTPAAKEFILSQNCRDFLAIEESPLGSRVYDNEYPNGMELQGHSLWTLPGLLSEILPR